jgi:stress-induced-phosphoprotein 1
LNKYEEALNDADVCTVLKADWWKGYYRKGLAQLKLNSFEEAEKNNK